MLLLFVVCCLCVCTRKRPVLSLLVWNANSEIGGPLLVLCCVASFEKRKTVIIIVVVYGELPLYPLV